MSYCRFSEESDVYLFGTGASGWECCGCGLYSEAKACQMFDTREQVTAHLDAHIAAGDMVPDYVYDRLRKEIKEIRVRHGLEV